MTSNRALAAIFLAPLVILLGVGVAVAIDSGDLGPLEFMALIGLATSALIFAVAWLLGSRATREHGPKFDALRAALGGSVLRNWLGEHQLRGAGGARRKAPSLRCGCAGTSPQARAPR